MVKTCSICKLPKPITEFKFFNREGKRIGRLAACQPCHRQRHRNGSLKKRFGITQEDFDLLLKSQNGVCAICRQPEKRTRAGNVKQLAVDHNHETNLVRGILCQDCNSALGYMNDDPERLRKAAEYIEDYTRRVRD